MAIDDREYEMNERVRFHNDLRRIERAPLADRRQACEGFLRAMREDPVIVGERVGWLLDGSYGRGAYTAAREVIRNRRMNRVAWLTQVTGALEWQCPQDMLVRAWKKLTTDEKARLKRAVERAMSEALAEGSNGRDRGRRKASRAKKQTRSLRRAYG